MDRKSKLVQSWPPKKVRIKNIRNQNFLTCPLKDWLYNTYKLTYITLVSLEIYNKMLNSSSKYLQQRSISIWSRQTTTPQTSGGRKCWRGTTHSSLENNEYGSGGSHLFSLYLDSMRGELSKLSFLGEPCLHGDSSGCDWVEGWWRRVASDETGWLMERKQKTTQRFLQ